MELKRISVLPPWEWPEDADSIFLKTIKDKSAAENDRVLAAALAGDYTVINDELADALLEVLLDTSESEDMRAQAALSFGVAFEHAFITEYEDPDEILVSEDKFRNIQATLKRLYTEEDLPKDVRRGILESSSRAPEEWHEKAVRDAYNDDDELWKLTAVFCMNYVEGFDKEIVESLKHEDVLVRLHAVSAAGNWQVDEAWSHVKNLLNNKDDDLDMLLAAIEAVAAIRPAESRELIMPFLESEDEEIAEAAHGALELSTALLEEEMDDDEDGLN